MMILEQFSWSRLSARISTLRLLLFLLNLAAYANSFYGDFIFDDYPAIIFSDSITKLWPVWPALWGFEGGGSSGRPVINYSLAVNFALSGGGTWSYHALNFLVHACTVQLLFSIIVNSLSLLRHGATRALHPQSFAFWVAALWSLHPVHTNAVSYIIIRNESMMALFYVLAMHCFIRMHLADRPGRHLAGGFLACLMGMMCKEVMATAPLTILLYDLMLPKTRTPPRKWRIAFHLLSFSSLILLYLLVRSGPRAGTTGFGLSELTAMDYFRTQAGVILHYLRLFLWPVMLNFDYYDWPYVRTWGGFLPAGAAAAAIIGTFLWLVRMDRIALFCLLWFVLILAPSSSFLPITEPAWEYRIYLPSFGIMVLLGYFASRLIRASGPGLRRHFAVFLAVLVTLLVQSTFVRNFIYQDGLELYRQTLGIRQGNYRTIYNIGVFETNRKKHDIGIPMMIRGLELYPTKTGRASGYRTLSTTYFNLKDYDKAEEYIQKAIAANPRDPDNHRELARQRSEQGRNDEAFTAIQECMAREKENAMTLHVLAVILAHRGDIEGAAAHARRAVQLRPQNLDFRANLATILEMAGQVGEAGENVQRVLSDLPYHPGALFVKGNLSARLGNLRQALAEYRRSLHRDPDNVRALTNMAATFADLGDPQSAIPLLDKAISLDPSFANAHNVLGSIHAEQGRPADAIPLFEKTIKLDPLAKEAYINLALANEALGNKARAVELLRQAALLDPDDPSIQALLSELGTP